MSLINSVLNKLTSFNPLIVPKAFGSMWRYPDAGGPLSVWPNYKPQVIHHKHKRRCRKPFSEAVQKESRMRCIDDSQLGQEAMAMGRPPRIIHVYSKRHATRPHAAYGVLGDIVKVAVKGEVKKAIICGLNIRQPHGVARFDTNNVVLIADDGTPLGKNVKFPVPRQLKNLLNKKTHYKQPEYNKMIKNVKTFV